MIAKIFTNACFPVVLALFMAPGTSVQARVNLLVSYDVVVLGGGTGGTAAGIQAGRLGVKTLLVEPSPWLGGMLTAAGVSATDGNHQMPAGIWGEFREKLRQHYGGAKALETGWVSNTHFEPQVGARLFAEMAKSVSTLEVMTGTSWTTLKRGPEGWEITLVQGSKRFQVVAKILVDGTDLGDVLAKVGAPFDVGMEAASRSGEAIGPPRDLRILQDLTYVAILADYGKGADRTIPRPKGYTPEEFRCSCRDKCPEKPRLVTCAQMLSYAKLPGEKYLINWPIDGNDIYLDVIDLSPKQRQKAFERAKEATRRYIYYVQTELGYRHLGLAGDTYPTPDSFPFLPYHREGRRLKGLVRMSVDHVLLPYRNDQPLYRTGMAVGDYPIDHHHGKYPGAPDLDFPPVPSFSIPFGALVPANTPGLVVADKAISVSNIVNGSTRLQPAVLQIGQAAGIIAAQAAKTGKDPFRLPIRDLQQILLDAKGYLMPYVDVSPEDPHFQEIQRVGATGLIRGIGEPYLWANRTWFYPDTAFTGKELALGVSELGLSYPTIPEGILSQESFCTALAQLSGRNLGVVETEFRGVCMSLGKPYDRKAILHRRMAAMAIDRIWSPFQRFPVGADGKVIATRPGS